MADEEFLANIARAIGATLIYSAGLQTAREMFGKSYFSLGVAEKVAVDQTVMSMIGSNYQNLMTPEYLNRQTGQPAGFQVPQAQPQTPKN